MDPLPLVKARVEMPPTSVAPAAEQQPSAAAPASGQDASAAALKAPEAHAPAEAIRASALKGQILSWWLSLSNTGSRKPSPAHVSPGIWQAFPTSACFGGVCRPICEMSSH